jgi:hypothetical protein
MNGSREDYINYRVIKSDETYNDALLFANNQRWNSCMNRLYYSSFYLDSALLYKHNIKTDTHNGIKSQFNFHFVKTGIVNLEFAKLYANLFDWRQESDYADFIDFEAETVEPFLHLAASFNEALKKLIFKD